jgi:hypothetical protein
MGASTIRSLVEQIATLPPLKGALRSPLIDDARD